MKKDIENIINKLNTLDINNQDSVSSFRKELCDLPFANMEDQHPFNARLVLLRSLDSIDGKVEEGITTDFDWCRSFFKRAMKPLIN